MSLNDTQNHGDTPIPVATPIDGPVEFCVAPNPMLLEKIPRSRAAAHLALLMAAFILMQVVAAFCIRAAYGADVTESDFAESATPVVLTVVVGIVLVVLAVTLMWRSECSAASIGLSFSNWKADCAIGLLVAIASYAGYIVSILVIALVSPEAIGNLQENPDRIKEMLPPIHPAFLTIVICLVAFWEEAIFRGVLVTHLRRMFGGWILATLISAGLFGLLHVFTQEPIVAIPLTVLGIIWTVFTVWRRSIVASVVGHALYNLGQIWMVYRMRGTLLPTFELVA